jgi:uncharacterized protein YgiM (DUF1202 family)
VLKKIIFLVVMMSATAMLSACTRQVEASDLISSSLQLALSAEETIVTDVLQTEDANLYVENQVEPETANYIMEEVLGEVGQVIAYSQEEVRLLPKFEIEEIDDLKFSTTSLNVRSGPSKEYSIIGYFRINEEVEITGIADTGWYRVNYLGEDGYVSNEFLSYDKVEIIVEAPIVPTEVVLDQSQSLTTDELVVVNELEQAATTAVQSKNYILNSSIDGSGTVFIGDSRTVGMYQAIRDNTSLWVGAVGKGRDWFVKYGSVQADPYITSGTRVVINLGVNDTGQIKKYITDMNSICQTWIDRGATIYYVSVNPLDYSKYVTNENIVSFNSSLQAGLSSDIKWIDTYSYLVDNGYATVDGIHYSKETSKSIYQYIISNM